MRKDYIDWLRNIAILYLFPYHTARIFDAMNSFYIKGVINTPSTNLVYISFWFMPLMFLLAGYSSFYALQKRSGKIYIKERFLRLFIPFIFGVIVIVPPQAYYAKKFHLNLQENYIMFFKKYFTDFSNWSEYAGGISPAHLWFILFLFIISIAMLPLMKFFIKKQIRLKWLENPLLISMVFIFLTVLSTLPDMSGKNIFLYCGYFIIGFFLATNDNIINNIGKYCYVFGLITLVGIVGLFIEKYFIGIQSGLQYKFIHYCIYWITLLTILGYGNKFLNKNAKVLTYFNKAAFPVYILHQTILVIIGYYILKIINTGIIPYISIMVITFIITIIIYEIISKIKIMKIMFGIK
jgi:surface polysaccharide O-acyltransferase-like enzyme